MSRHYETATTPITINDVEFSTIYEHPLNVRNAHIKEFMSEFIGMYFFILLSLGNIANLVCYPNSNMS